MPWTNGKKLGNNMIKLSGILVGLVTFGALTVHAQHKLIAHRGGVVDSVTAENSLQALEKAIDRGYDRVEIDVRISKDSIFLIHHDRNLARYYGREELVSELPWSSLKELRGTLGNRVHTLEEVLTAARGRIKIMVDMKIPGGDRELHGKLVQLLEKHGLLRDAMMIGSSASTDFYRGKIALSCTRQQLEENLRRSDFKPEHYYLFSGKITAEDVTWAHNHGIRVVGAINAWGFKGDDMMRQGEQAATALIDAGVREFQIDSVFEPLLRQ